MAGDWIKMRCDLFTHPKVVRISSALKADRLRTVGGLMSVWCLFDAHSVDGLLEGYTVETLDEHISWPGFSALMMAVGWLQQNGDCLELPRFDAHNGQSAKRRAQDADRKREDRKTSASNADKKRTREEKRREDSKPPISPQGDNPGRQKPRVALRTFLDDCKAKGERPVRDYQPLWQYVESAKLPDDYVTLAWAEFCRQFLPDGVQDAKRQADWRKTFRNYVEKNYLKLWAIDKDDNYFLTSHGKQAEKFHESRAAA